LENKEESTKIFRNNRNIWDWNNGRNYKKLIHMTKSSASQ
jgi:hypothetical protein